MRRSSPKAWHDCLMVLPGGCQWRCSSRRAVMASNDRVTVQITDGPGKWDLMIALFYRPEGDNRQDHLLTFTLETGEKITVLLRKVEMEDGSHDSWILNGHIIRGDGNYEKIDFYYTSKRRTGVWMKDA